MVDWIFGISSMAFAEPIASSELPAKEFFHLLPVAGQANMAGRCEVSDADRKVNPRIRALNADGEWQHAVDPIHWDKPVAGVGHERSFAEEYLKVHPGVTVVPLVAATVAVVFVFGVLQFSFAISGLGLAAHPR